MAVDYGNLAIFYAVCTGNLVKNFIQVPCVTWYLLNLIGIILYFPFTLLFWGIESFSGIDVTYYVDTYFWGTIYFLSDLCQVYLGFPFAHFPPYIIQSCYECPAEAEKAPKNKKSIFSSKFMHYVIVVAVGYAVISAFIHATYKEEH
jgi:hypothetical protein